jgi:hypothetical protein
MSHERTPPIRPADAFDFTEGERLYNRVSDTRLSALLDDEAVKVHEVSESSNDYGEFVFVTLSRPASDQRVGITFWGLGYHEWRERWLHDEWFWYTAYLPENKLAQTIPTKEAIQQLQKRREGIQPHITETEIDRSRSARFFEMLADLTDEDDARITLEDMGDFFLDDPG